MNNKKQIWYGITILLAGVISFVVLGQQKQGTHRATFSGQWKSRESISMGGNIVCTYSNGDRMLSNTMKIAEGAGSLTVEVPNPSSRTPRAVISEKLTFDGKERHIDYDHDRGKKFTARLSSDGKIMTVNSLVHLMVVTPYNVKVLRPLVVHVTEVWKLNDDGKSISVQTTAKSTSFDKGRFWTTVFERVG